MKLLAHLSSK